MEILQWHDSFSVGVQAIDDQHRQLFAHVNDLINAFNRNEEGQEVERTLQAVLDYTEKHFRAEEELLQIHPDFHAHCRIHGAFEAGMRALAADFTGGGGISPAQLLQELTDWLRNHILKTDIAFFSEMGYRPLELREDVEARLRLLHQRTQVLIVEDSAVQRRVLRASLESEGFEVLEAGDGAEALRVFDEATELRLVVTDLEMPVMNGYELIQAIRSRSRTSAYIIVLTSATGKQSLVESFKAGANDYLSKPVFHEELHLRLCNGMNLLRLESQDELIFSMAKLADCRSPETGQHLERVQIFTRLLGQEVMRSLPELGMTEGIVADIARFSPLHDIGKVAIEDRILNKPGRLTPGEFDVMKTHASVGGDLIGSILRRTASRSLRLAYELTMFHHEKWDGTGYPAGLKGLDIPISARILAIADVYDAVTSDRVYRASMTREQARALILDSAGTHFDPDLVAAFATLEPRFHQLREEFGD